MSTPGIKSSSANGVAITEARQRTLNRLLPRLTETFERFGGSRWSAGFTSGLGRGHGASRKRCAVIASAIGSGGRPRPARIAPT